MINPNDFGIRGAAGKNWTLTNRIFGNPVATYDCGACGKYNAKTAVIPGNLPRKNVQIAITQCKWCGEFNTFWNGTSVQILS